MLDLTKVTLISITTLDYQATRKSIQKCKSLAKFGKIIVFTDKPKEFPDIETILIPTMQDKKEYALHKLKTVPKHWRIFNDFTLNIQWDSWIVNPEAWTDRFFDYDYIGAAWKDGTVGNDGFCLMSKRMWKILDDLQIPTTVNNCYPSDCVLCKTSFRREEDNTIVKGYRGKLEQARCRFASPEVADRFSVENKPYNGSFGFHGISVLADLYRKGIIENTNYEKPYESSKIKTFSHYGDLGDLIYAMPAIKEMGGGKLVLYPRKKGQDRFGVREPFYPEKVEKLKSFFEIQPYISKVEFSNSPKGMILDKWREAEPGSTKNLADTVCSKFNLPIHDPHRPWAKVDFLNPVAEVVIHRSERYKNKDFPWNKAVSTFKDIIFIGAESEHEKFCSQFGYVPYYPTPTLLDLARVIAGCKLFIGNQSAPRALAEALKVPVWVEEAIIPKNTNFGRVGATYDFHMPSPEEYWLENQVARAGYETLISNDRLKEIVKAVEQTSHLGGEMAEFGTYLGGSALVIASTDPSRNLTVYDTFEGIPEDDKFAAGHKKGDFGDVSLEKVKKLLDLYKVNFRVGFFPDTAEIDQNLNFSFAHIDCDTYQSVKAGIEFFVPRMLSGGIIVFDDYEWKGTPGVKKAIEEYNLKIVCKAQNQAIYTHIKSSNTTKNYNKTKSYLL